MRLVVLAAVCLAACASERLQQAPRAGVDFTGAWKLNEADSDDPQHLLQAQFTTLKATESSSQSGSRGGRQGGGRGAAGGGISPGGPGGPVMPSVGAMSEGLRWPGKQLEIKQVAGVVAFTSEGSYRICQPNDEAKRHRRHDESDDRGGGSSGRNEQTRARDMPPARCGWTEKTLIVQGGDPDDEHPPFEEHYSLSDDGQRLIEVVGFKGGRSSGFTMTRVWDRSIQ